MSGRLGNGRASCLRSGRRSSVSVLACAALANPLGWNELSHYAQTLSFDAGTPIIDPYAAWTGYKAVFQGHFYSDKAPGLSFLTVPVHLVAQLTGMDAQHTVHLLAIFGCLVPAAAPAAVGFQVRGGLRAGIFGVVVALTLGLGTLLLPFSTMYFSHVLAACLGFAAYYLLWLERERVQRPIFLVGAGLLAGLAVARPSTPWRSSRSRSGSTRLRAETSFRVG